jgi:hypothetical protein
MSSLWTSPSPNKYCYWSVIGGSRLGPLISPFLGIIDTTKLALVERAMRVPCTYAIVHAMTRGCTLDVLSTYDPQQYPAINQYLRFIRISGQTIRDMYTTSECVLIGCTNPDPHLHSRMTKAIRQLPLIKIHSLQEIPIFVMGCGTRCTDDQPVVRVERPFPDIPPHLLADWKRLVDSL